MRRSVLYQPLAVLLALLLLPWVAVVSGDRNHFTTSAQIIISCNGQGIIKSLCGADGLTSAGEISGFETNAVNAWLAAHQLPADNTVYQYGRVNLRNELRAFLLASILGIIQKPAAQRTAREQTVYNWMQSKLKLNEVLLYQAAIAEWNKYNVDRCNYQLDQDIANAYNITYDPTPFCYAQSPLSIAFSFPATPAASYFLAVGLKKSYGAALAANNQYGAAISYATANNMPNATALPLAVGAGTGVGAALAVAGTAASIFPATVGVAAATAAGVEVSFSSAYVAAVSATAPLTTGLATAGAGAIIAVAVAIAIQAGIQAVNNQAQIDQLNGLNATLTSVQASDPDLSTFLNDDQGRYKLNATFVTQTLPDTPSTAPLPQHQAGTDLDLSVAPEGDSGVGTSSAQATYQDWNQNQVSITTWGGYLIQTVTSSDGKNSSSSITPTMHYLDWAGNQTTASRSGSVFLVVRNGSTQPSCPVDSTTKLSTQAPQSCSSYVTDVLQVVDKDGHHVSLRISGLPVFSTNASFSTRVNTTGSGTITVTSGAPVSDFKVVGAVPPGLTVTPVDGNNIKVQFGPSSQPRQDSLLFSATNAFGTVTQNVSFISYTDLQFTSVPSISAIFGNAVRYRVATNAGSTVTFNSSGFDAYGLTVTNAGDGTATIAGILNGPLYLLCGGPEPCPTITASNGVQTLTTPVTITVQPKPITLPEFHDTTVLGYFAPGSLVSSELPNTIGAGTVSFTGKLPAGLSLANPTGSMGVKVTGTPAIGSEGSYSIVVTTSYLGADKPVYVTINIGVLQKVTFTTLPQAVFYLNRLNTFGVGVVGTPTPTLLNSNLPSWLTFTYQPQVTGGTGKLSGTPTATGSVPIQFLALQSTGAQVTQNFTLYIRRPGDVDGDGLTTCADYQVIKRNLGQVFGQPGFNAAADYNGDGVVSIEDLSALALLLTGSPVCR